MGDYDVLDGTGEDLAIQRVYRDGFSGSWQSDLGIAMIRDQRGDCTSQADIPAPAGPVM